MHSSLPTGLEPGASRAASIARAPGRRAVRAAIALVTFALLLAAPAPTLADENVADFRASMREWVETNRIVSEEKSDWEVERETLRATRDLLRQRKKDLEADIAELESKNTGTDETRRELVLRRGEYQRVSAEVEQKVVAMERQALELATRLPAPLQKKLQPLLVQIPEDPEKSAPPLGQRLVNVLGILAQTEKFNSTATFVGETRSVGGDQKVQVRTLYWGLGQAMYVDAQGRVAGIGRPGEAGWEFSQDPELTDESARLLDIYEGNVDEIGFVKLPVEVR